VIAQYVKDVSFENPNAPESLVGGWPPPETGVQVFWRSSILKTTLLKAACISASKPRTSRTAHGVHHRPALRRAGGAEQYPGENQAAVLMVEVPKLLFPSLARSSRSHLARRLPAAVPRAISFETIFMNEVKRQQAEKSKQVGTA